MSRSRWLAVIGAMLAAAACGGASSAPESAGPTVAVATAAAGPREATPSALADPSDKRHPPPLIDLDELVAGGPPPDGIPAIDRPRFTRAAEVDFLADNEPVLVLDLGGDARAYPLQIMIWHEIANDVVGGVPVSVTYCPLCNSALAFDRRLGQRLLDFGTSGMLYRSALVMYDRKTQSLWSHFDGGAIVGTLAGARLTRHPVAMASWKEFAAAHPAGLVLNRATGFSRDYGQNPYPGYDNVDEPPFLFRGATDARLAAKTRVVGIDHGGEAVAVVLGHLAERGVVEVTVGGQRLVVFHRPGTASALDAARVDDGVDVGTTGVFVARVEGADVSFTARDGAFVDSKTGTSWDVLGRSGVSNARLEPVVHVDTFWFAWAAYLPHSRIVR